MCGIHCMCNTLDCASLNFMPLLTFELAVVKLFCMNKADETEILSELSI